jgi:chemotaxis protein methyltransferase CheR
MIEIGIVDTRNIINLINEKYKFDFSDYALTSFKRRIERIIERNNFKYPDLLLNKLMDSKDFFEQFVEEVSVPSTEMFRDPSLWRILREEIINGIYRETGSNFKIWLPNSVSGDELFSLTILLSEIGMLEKVQILVSCLSDKNIETIKSGIFQGHKLEISLDNYTRSNGKSTLSNYYSTVNGQIIRDTSLIKNVTFFRQNTFLEPIPQGVKLVLFRNKMIYFNQTLQSKILKTLYQATSNGSILILGIKESINCLYGNEFTTINNMDTKMKEAVTAAAK